MPGKNIFIILQTLMLASCFQRIFQLKNHREKEYRDSRNDLVLRKNQFILSIRMHIQLPQKFPIFISRIKIQADETKKTGI